MAKYIIDQSDFELLQASKKMLKEIAIVIQNKIDKVDTDKKKGELKNG